MHLTAPSNWSRSIGTGGRDPSERVVTIAGMRIQTNDVLFTEGGDFDKLGRGTVWYGQIEPCLHQNHVFAVRPKPKRLIPEFLAYQASCEYGRRYFQLSSKQSTNLASIRSARYRHWRFSRCGDIWRKARATSWLPVNMGMPTPQPATYSVKGKAPLETAKRPGKRLSLKVLWR